MKLTANFGFQKTSIAFICFLCSLSAHAEFTLDFMPDDGGAMGMSADTPWLMRGSLQLPEIVVDPDTGLDYFHIIMGDPSSGFMQDIYIERGFSTFQGGDGSAVGGGGNGGNNVQPLDAASGTGQANPRKVLVRQIVSDGEIYMDFTKDKLDRKPKITQMLTLPDMSSIFQIDMSNSTYGDDLTPGVVFYTMALADDYKDQANFNFATDIQKSIIDGGRYTYTNGSGPGGSAGTYLYDQGGFDIDAVSWEVYFDHSIENPWSNSTNKPQP
ncbi:MAG: hypothetical protein COB33_001790 [Thiotrichaceae bacterium]|nr:hypothetical protein [Thiotrichaceae bacterium]PCI13585.1 MAG: hypothetical protein COB71_05415 [Thiotrichales bacterium]